MKPVTISERDNSDELALDTDCDPRYSYHYMVPEEFIEKYNKVMGEYWALMKELKQYKKHLKDPTE